MTSISAFLPSRFSAANREPQVLEFVEAKSGGKVILVGAMHYNPVSIARARDVTTAVAARGALSCVLLETCKQRWMEGETMRAALSPFELSLYKAVLPSEMAAAAEVAQTTPGARLILGDQSIETTGVQFKACLAATLADLLDPLNGGWKRIADDIMLVFSGAGDAAEGLGVTLADYTDPALLINMPVSFLRYPTAIAVRSPKTVVLVASAVWLLENLGDLLPAASSVFPADGTAESWLATIAVTFLETLFLGRVMLGPILNERNEVLARNIAAACARASADGEDGGTVVAILGMAHLNGVQRLLLEKGASSSSTNEVMPADEVVFLPCGQGEVKAVA